MTDAVSFALYRKYRPESFDAVRNQDHIVSVLKGALSKNMIPHALLFTGGRGTGKTTVARIFAHAVGAHDIDIYEIDAASNRGIDDIRQLKEAVHTVPYESPYKVYIIDEVHMLSKDAFNALLKTLEEPPQHVIFILATTEKDKVLDTIVSRCQIFEFRSPTREELRVLIMDIAASENYTLESSAADVIALAADGSYRDALGITQKVIMASGDTVLSADEVAAIVGAPKNVLLEEILISFHTKEIARALTALSQAREAHVDSKLLYTLILERIRAVIMLRYNPALADTIMMQCSEPEKKLIREYAADTKSPINSALLTRALRLGEFIGKSHIAELPLELLCIEHATQ